MTLSLPSRAMATLPISISVLLVFSYYLAITLRGVGRVGMGYNFPVRYEI